MKKKLLSALLAVVMLTGCANRNTTDDTQKITAEKTGAPATISELPLKEPITLNIMAQADASVSVDYENMEFWKMVEKATNIKVNWTISKGDEFAQKKNLMFASGEYPDVILSGINANEEDIYGTEQQILIPLDSYINKEYMPNYSALVDSRPNFKKQMIAMDGHIYSMSRVWEIGYNTNGHIFINKKWLDKLGLQIPTTIEDFETVLRAFKEDDPNGNGKPDEIPLELVLKDDVSCAVTNLFGLFGQLDTPNHLVLEDDKVVFSANTDGYRKGLEWISKTYADGLIDKEAFSHDLSTYYAKIKGGNVGCFIGWRLTGVAHSFEGIEEQFVCIDPPKSKDVDPIWYKSESASMVGGAVITSSNKHVAETIKWLDYLINPDIAFQAKHGVTGIYQEVNESGKYVMKNKEDGTPYTNEEINSDCPGPGSLFFLPSDVIKEKYNLSSLHLEKYPYCEQYAPYLSKQSPDLINRGRLSQTDRDTNSRLRTDIDKLVDERTIQFISQGVTDASWNSYNDTLNKMKLDEYIALNQKSFDAFNKN